MNGNTVFLVIFVYADAQYKSSTMNSANVVSKNITISDMNTEKRWTVVKSK